MINTKELEHYKDYGRALEISNGNIRAVVTLDIGPRIIFFGFVGGQNIMSDNRDLLGGRTENSYQADLLIYQDNEQQSFYNLFQGIDIAVLSGQDSVQVVLGIDGSGKLTCLSLGTAE